MVHHRSAPQDRGMLPGQIRNKQKCLSSEYLLKKFQIFSKMNFEVLNLKLVLLSIAKVSKIKSYRSVGR